jgi:hypothetical protein
MVKSRIRRLTIIAALVFGTMLAFLVLPALAAEQVLAVRSAVGNHYETPLVLDLTAGQVVNINAYCTDASGTGITYVHYIEVGAVPTAEHPEYNDSIYYQRWDCLAGVNAPYTAPVGTQYRFIFHVHTNQYGCSDAESCPTLTGISHFNYYLKVTTGVADTPVTPEPTAQVTAEPTAEPTAEATSDPSSTAEPTPESTSEPTATPSKAATPVPVVSLPEMPRDARLNFKTGDLTAVVYRNRDDKGAPAIVIYGVNESSRGYLLCTVTNADLGDLATQAPKQNTLVKRCSAQVVVYVLTTGEIQINISEQNKVFVTVLDSLEASVIQRSLLEA